MLSVAVMNVCGYTSAHAVCLHGVDRDSFTFHVCLTTVGRMFF